MTDNMSKPDRELIRNYREYNEDKDPERHKFSEIYLRLSKRVGTSNRLEIENWISEQERNYEPIPEVREDDIEIESIELRKRDLEQKVAAAKNPEDRAFFERLLHNLNQIEQNQ